MRRSAGFTLLELVMVMVIIGVGMAGIAGIFGNTSGSLSLNETQQQASQYAQECAERLLATRRDLGFAWFASNTFACDNPSGFTLGLSIGSLYTGTSTAATTCPNGVQCRDVRITVSRGSASSAITVMLANHDPL
jgi:type IV pilus assembly protein PilV